MLEHSKQLWTYWGWRHRNVQTLRRNDELIRVGEIGMFEHWEQHSMNLLELMRLDCFNIRTTQNELPKVDEIKLFEHWEHSMNSLEIMRLECLNTENNTVWTYWGWWGWSVWILRTTQYELTGVNETGVFEHWEQHSMNLLGLMRLECLNIENNTAWTYWG